jgi:hypothetical protein
MQLSAMNVLPGDPSGRTRPGITVHRDRLLLKLCGQQYLL